MNPTDLPELLRTKDDLILANWRSKIGFFVLKKFQNNMFKSPFVLAGGPFLTGGSYAQTLIVVTLIVVKNFGFLVITRSHERFGGRH